MPLFEATACIGGGGGGGAAAAAALGALPDYQINKSAEFSYMWTQGNPVTTQ